ncbi:MAG TPA: hypothetical protein VEY90_00095, partial [Thermoleophilaceae bacterium]|nr:hypothetical protein [Thermoleophilaceae bacterium]
MHNHAVPREAVELLRTDAGYPIRVEGDFMEADRVRAELTSVFVDPRAKLEQLEQVGLEAAVVSVSPALFAYEADEERGASLCRAVNRGLAELCTHDPSRLRWIAHVPLQAPDAAVELMAEAAGASALGAQIGTSVAGTPLTE